MRGTNEQLITLGMDTSPAEQAARQFQAAELKRAKERAKEEAKAAKEAVKARADAEAEVTRAARAADKERNDSDKAYVRAKRQEANALNALAKEQASAQKAARKEVEDADKAYVRAKRQEANALGALAREQAAAEKAAKKEAADSDRAYVRAKMREAKALAAMEKEQAANSLLSKDAVMGWIAGFASIGTVIAGVKAIADYMAAIQHDTIRATEETLRMREAVLELAALKDQLGKTGPVLGEQILLRAKTGMGEQAANDMEAHFLGRAEAALGKTVNAEQTKELRIAMGQLQRMEGSGAAAYGDLGGTIALTAKPGATSADLKAQLNRLYEIQRPGGYTKMSQFSEQYSKASSLVQNGIYTPEELAALLSMQSLASPEEAETRVSQMTRLASSGLMRARHIKGAPGVEHDTTAEFFQKAGITQGMGGMQRLERLSDFLIKEQDQAAKNNKPYMLREEILGHGVVNVEDAEALENFIGYKRSGVWAKTFLPLMNAKNAPDTIREKFEERFGREPVDLVAQGKLSEDIANIQRSNDPSGQIRELRRAAFSKMSAERKVAGTFKEFEDQAANPWTKFWWDSFGDYYNKVDVEAQKMLIEQAKKHHIDYRKTLNFDETRREETEDYAGDKRLAALQLQIQQAGGNPLAGVADRAIEANAILNKMEESMRKIEENTRPAGKDVIAHHAMPGSRPRPLQLKPPALDGIRQAGAY